jgi:hypothetical protein
MIENKTLIHLLFMRCRRNQCHNVKGVVKNGLIPLRRVSSLSLTSHSAFNSGRMHAALYARRENRKAQIIQIKLVRKQQTFCHGEKSIHKTMYLSQQHTAGIL